jgi:predicted hydrocarbon binding protein
MDKTHELRTILQESMNLLAATACGLEDALGQPANTVSLLAGEKLGRQFAKGKSSDDVLKALEDVQQILKDNGCLWCFESFKPKNQEEMIQHTEEGQEVKLVFRDCMIRQALFRFGHHQKGSLCNLMNGFFASAIETITGHEASLEIIHAGENACIKKLTVRTKQDSKAGAKALRESNLKGELSHE